MLTILSSSASAFRVKDIASLRGDRINQLIGFSVVIGLNGTGDTQESILARKPIVNAIEKMGIKITPEDIKGRGLAAVVVTGTLPSFSKQGQKIDIVVSALGDSVSLRGGVLVMTPLRGPDKVTYAIAQGLVSDVPQGIELPANLETLGATQLRINPKSSSLSTVGRVIQGALIEREIDFNLNTRTRIYMNLFEPDFTNAFRLAKAVNRNFADDIAKASDAGTVEIDVPHTYLGNTVEMVSKIENLEIQPDIAARVVIDERMGTVVMSRDVKVLPVALAHGNLKITIDKLGTEERKKRQEELIKMLRLKSGLPAEGITTGQGAQLQPNNNKPELDPDLINMYALDDMITKENVTMINASVDLKDLVDGLNKIGVSNQELMEILKLIKAAGALKADLIVNYQNAVAGKGLAEAEKLQSKLKHRDHSDPKEFNKDLVKSAQKFEAVFIKQILEESRRTYEESGLFEKTVISDFNKDIYDDKMSEYIAQNGGIGIGKIIYDKYKRTV
ncbi:hypothetical protein CHS0354_026832 [Potamilus streckersoni]|uniref:Flagellar protein FlgJ N-terminal domain-containing protein n=1 Tax=Potamilus streckersoni TaxID=2493646 RepID=A0AAE0T5L7_9BIVA|nr:hypothetical protein CHS0354_026832 [Potamilus streckersoni]